MPGVGSFYWLFFLITDKYVCFVSVSEETANVYLSIYRPSCCFFFLFGEGRVRAGGLAGWEGRGGEGRDGEKEEMRSAYAFFYEGTGDLNERPDVLGVVSNSWADRAVLTPLFFFPTLFFFFFFFFFLFSSSSLPFLFSSFFFIFFFIMYCKTGNSCAIYDYGGEAVDRNAKCSINWFGRTQVRLCGREDTCRPVSFPFWVCVWRFGVEEGGGRGGEKVV